MPPRLRRVDCSAPGIRRRRRGRGFSYVDEAGDRIDDPEVLRRIAELAIPPAWRDVWICPYPNGHLQATGTDAAGRKQYRYHDAWRSEDINAYLKDATGGDFSAKDFRTWNATALAAVALAVSGASAGTRTARRRAVNRAIEEVAGYLGNTPAVCRASYIDPRVLDAYDAGLTIGPALERVAAEVEPGDLPIHQPELERAVLDLICERQPSTPVERIAA